MSLFSCAGWREYTYHGVEYQDSKLGWSVVSIDHPVCDSKNVYVLDEIDGEPVEVFGMVDFFGVGPYHHINNYSIEKIYFPWSIMHADERNGWTFRNWEDDMLKYVISSSTTTLVGVTARGLKFVVPSNYYIKLNTVNPNGYKTLNEEELAFFLPANISYFFNYEDNPNEGYFFVDIIEETGKLTKPPYDPKREGYRFDGWYKEAECINEWNFDIDEVSIKFDDDGNRIYEEICLYAKWVENK